MYRFRNLSHLLGLGVILISTASFASTSSLSEWEPWILDDQPTHGCPWVLHTNKTRSCVWPGRLSLNATDKGAQFEFNADVFGKIAFVPLPGSEKHWPTSVTINGAPAPIVERNKIPHLSLSAGKYTIKGEFTWARKPGQLTVPAAIAIISLKVDGQSHPVNHRGGKLIFSSKSATISKQSRDSLQIEVYRLITDGVPVSMQSNIKLSVSGKAREVTFGKVQLKGSEIQALRSPIPARIESDGTMRAQVTPGEHEIHITARFTENPDAINIEPLTSDWPTYEYVSFRADPAIRQAKLSGAISIDTTQISMPDVWAGLPTYRVGKEDTLIITTEGRGDQSPAANELNVSRDLWLDFNGSGITTLDRISGIMNTGWRINAATGVSIGRATVGGEPVLITVDEGAEGIETRSPSIELEAVTRIADTSRFSAAGWDARAETYKAKLHLPPGWRVLHASGVDRISGTWVSQWDLWDVFLVLVIVAATRRLISTKAAILAFVSLLVAYHERDNPLLMMPVLLIIAALLPVVSGKLKSTLSITGASFAVILVLSLISFAVGTLRLAIYPSLERAVIGEYSGYSPQTKSLEPEPMFSKADEMELSIAGRGTKQVASKILEKDNADKRKRSADMYQVLESDRVQTGPGLPTWTWNSAHFYSSGPVLANQEISVNYSSPWMTSLWRVISVLLAAIYSGFVLLRLSKDLDFKTGNPPTKPAAESTDVPATVTTVILAGFMFTGTIGLTPSSAQADEFPPEYLMKEFKNRLIKPPECLPGCASLNNGRIVINESSMTLTFDAYVDANIALPLPTVNGRWRIKEVLANGKPAPLRVGRGLFVRLSEGNHRIELSGTLTGDRASISLPLPIHNIKTSAKNWVIEGLVDGRVRGNTLSLRSVDESNKQEMDTLKPDPIAAFVSVKRSFSFHKQWRVTTTVVRVAPEQGAISIAIPLLPNENLLTDVGSVSDGLIKLQLGSRQQKVSWDSTMEPVDQLNLIAAQGRDYVEEWTFIPSSLWRLSYNGIPPIKGNNQSKTFVSTFKPWPGENLNVDIRRPAGVPGPTHTVERASLILTAGQHLQRSQLSLGIRSSLGEDYIIKLPVSAEVLSISIDGRSMNIPADNNIKIPLQPGFQNVVVDFQEPISMGVVSKTPVIELPDGATNIEIAYTLPSDRWPLYLNGPSIGPAMLYWGVLCVIVIGALALPSLAKRVGLNMPINMAGWLLLGLGLSTVNGYGVMLLAAMFFLLAARKQFINPDGLSRLKFNFLQVFIVLWVMVAVMFMLSAIPMGLLSNPEMKVVGNGSSSHLYNYYQDIVGNERFPVVTVFNVPMIAYRVVMLLWSLWLATKIIEWAGWGWSCFAEKRLWRSSEKK